MDFKKRIIDELKLTPIQSDTMLKDYIEVCEKLAKEYHALQLLQPDVSSGLLLQTCKKCNSMIFDVNGKKCIQCGENHY